MSKATFNNTKQAVTSMNLKKKKKKLLSRNTQVSWAQ